MEAVLVAPPPRPPLRSADPPHKGEGSQLRHVSNSEGPKACFNFVICNRPAARGERYPPRRMIGSCLTLLAIQTATHRDLRTIGWQGGGSVSCPQRKLRNSLVTKPF